MSVPKVCEGLRQQADEMRRRKPKSGNNNHKKEKKRDYNNIVHEDVKKILTKMRVLYGQAWDGNLECCAAQASVRLKTTSG